MRRFAAFLMAVMLVLSCTAVAFATDNTQIDVYAKHEREVSGEYTDRVKNGGATVTVEDAVVSVSNAPANAVLLVVIPLTGNAESWISGCVDGSVMVAYDIHFVDADGNRINADGTKVIIAVSESENVLFVSSVTTAGADKVLEAEINNGKVSFTADGSHYYVIAETTNGEEPTPGPGETLMVPVSGEENTVHAEVTVNDDTVTLHDLAPEEIQHIVGDDVSTGVVEIDLTGLDDDVTKINLPVTTIEQILEAAEEAHNDTEALQINFPSGSVKLDDQTMRAIVEQAECNTIMLVLENVGETRLNDAQEDAIKDWNVYGGYEAYLFCVKGNKRISDFKGGVATLSVPFKVPNGLDASKFSVWYVADDGKTEKLATWYENGRLVWSVGHFSDFIIVYEGEEVPDDPVTPPTGDDAVICLWVTVAIVSVAMLFFLVYLDRKRTRKV